MAKLLVSVRSAVEAQAALAGGAAIIDVKEPSHGSLGRAACSVWRDVRAVVPPAVPMSVALGELTDWLESEPGLLPRGCWSGVAFRKLGLFGAGPDWSERWRDLRRRFDEESGLGPAWVSVVYTDWQLARAPDPDAIISAAIDLEDCRGVLFDTWDKSRRARIDLTWGRWTARVKESGRFVALAGSLDAESVRRLRPLEPEIFAVRGAACRAGDRRSTIDSERVARLVEAAQ